MKEREKKQFSRAGKRVEPKENGMYPLFFRFGVDQIDENRALMILVRKEIDENYNCDTMHEYLFTSKKLPKNRATSSIQHTNEVHIKLDNKAYEFYDNRACVFVGWSTTEIKRNQYGYCTNNVVARFRRLVRPGEHILSTPFSIPLVAFESGYHSIKYIDDIKH